MRLLDIQGLKPLKEALELVLILSLRFGPGWLSLDQLSHVHLLGLFVGFSLCHLLSYFLYHF
jgi:hypothetical protein